MLTRVSYCDSDLMITLKTTHSYEHAELIKLIIFDTEDLTEGFNPSFWYF